MTDVFHHTPLSIAFLNEIYDPFYCLNWFFFCWNHVSFQLNMPNCLLKSAIIVFYNRLIHTSKLLSSICFSDANPNVIP